MKRKKYFLTGAAIAFASAALLVGASKRKPRQKWIYVGMVLAAIAGFVAAFAVAYHPRKEERKKLKLQEMIDLPEVDRLEENISEVLGNVADKLLH